MNISGKGVDPGGAAGGDVAGSTEELHRTISLRKKKTLSCTYFCIISCTLYIVLFVVIPPYEIPFFRVKVPKIH